MVDSSESVWSLPLQPLKTYLRYHNVYDHQTLSRDLARTRGKLKLIFLLPQYLYIYIFILTLYQWPPNRARLWLNLTGFYSQIHITLWTFSHMRSRDRLHPNAYGYKTYQDGDTPPGVSVNSHDLLVRWCCEVIWQIKCITSPLAEDPWEAPNHRTFWLRDQHVVTWKFEKFLSPLSQDL